ncbi:hypothetical protein TPA0598_05_05420 [Streptomyces lydicamycinicus]|uniref:Uncharacterized protein n=1 Tax=Streptomyces lydicamycinicus TaxID=1546107 RepID=A0A0P4R8V4_9ACTN|nr:hypothetical protein TPA0598_05_05420 [Streptomyces lydicamycinicus]
MASGSPAIWTSLFMAFRVPRQKCWGDAGAAARRGLSLWGAWRGGAERKALRGGASEKAGAQWLRQLEQRQRACAAQSDP